jgi:adenylate kinase family enzyme
MPWLTADENLTRPPARVLVAGTSGSGKSTLARRIANALGISYFEIDALYHGPGWTPRPEFVAEVTARTEEPCWVTEWQYHSVRNLLADRVEMIVWLDLPRYLVMWRVISRTLARSILRAELWNGNREPPLRTILTNEDHIIRWAWRTHRKSLARLTEYLARRPDLPVVRLRTRGEVERWVGGPLARAALGGDRSPRSPC